MGSWKLTIKLSTPNMFKALGLVFLASSAYCANPLPDYMIGSFVLDTSNGFNDYMSALGVNIFTRTIACALTPTATNKQTSNGDITIETSSTFRSTSVTFKLNTPFKENTADGRTASTTALLQGNRLIKTQRGKPFDTIETREFVDNGKTMRLIHTIPSQPKIRSVRVYRRQ